MIAGRRVLDEGMNDTNEYEPSPTDWVREQVEKIEETGDTRSVSIMDMDVVLMTMTGARTGKVRKVPVMRVEHDGDYAAVASKGGAPDNPAWFSNLSANPDIELQDGTESWPARARRLAGDERSQWWDRAVDAYPPYAEYQQNTDRQIPVFVLERR